jgi:iron complex outermembrane recepter protein
MDVRRRILIASVSAVAMAGAAAPAFAADAAKPDNEVGEVVVTGFRESLERAIQIKRETINQVDAISSTDIGKLPDHNVADALQRVPGVNTSSSAGGEGGFDENDRVSIRGTSPSLTQVTVDGHAVATGDWFILDQYQTVGRSVSFNLLPAEIVSSTLVYKTQSADLMEGGVAGVVDVITHKPLDFTRTWTFQGQAEAAYNSISGETKPQLNGFVNWKNDDNTFGVSVAGFYEQRSVERFGQETLGYTAITAAMPIGAAHPDTIGVQAPTLIGSSLFKQEKTREGGSFAVEYRPTDRVELSLTGFYSKLDASNVNDNYMFWGSNELNNNSPTSYTIKDNTLVGAVWPAGPNGLVVDAITRPHEGSYTDYINLDGKFRVNDHLTLKGQFGYTQGGGNTPEQPSFEVDGGNQGVTVTRAGNGWTISPVGVNTQSPAGLANDWAWNAIFTSVDKEIYGKVDGDWELGDGVFKDALFGFRIAQHTRQVDGWDRGCTLGANNQCWNSPTMPYSAVNPSPYPSGYTAGALGVPGLLIPIAGDPTTIGTVINAINDGVHGPASVIHTPQNYYWLAAFKVKELDYSGYLMAKVGGDGWRGNFGVRLVGTQENAYVNVPSAPNAQAVPITSSAFGTYYINHVEHTYFDVLPSLNFTFDLKPNLFLRMSAAETMSRPDYSALGGTVSLTDLTLTGSGGNANLKPIKSAVYDVALEWYYAPQSVAAISVFYDDLSSYVSYGLTQGVYVDQLLTGNNGPPVYKTYNISSPVNTSGELKGIELQVQQPIGMGFGFQANATYIDGHETGGGPLVGTSKWTANVVGYYENKWLSVRLAYTYRSHYFIGLDHASPENEASVGQLDASVNVNVTKNITLSVDALNMTNSKLIYYAANPTQVRAVYDNGTQVFAGVHVKF